MRLRDKRAARAEAEIEDANRAALAAALDPIARQIAEREQDERAAEGRSDAVCRAALERRAR